MTPSALDEPACQPTSAQRRVVLAVAMAGVAIASICAGIAGVEWPSWQLAIVLFVAFDLVGGVAALCLPAAIHKFRPPGDTLRAILFAAFHVHPLLLAFVLPGMDWAALSTIYLSGVGGVLLVTVIHPEFRASAALTWCAITLAVVALIGIPPGLEWLAPAFVLKLVGSHAVSCEAR